MRLKQYILNEKTRSKLIDTETECIRLLNKHCINALTEYKKSNAIYRGVSNGNNYLYIDPKSGEPRKSANTYNFYTLINDNSKQWNNYPKRSRSIICSTNRSSAAGYGDLYYVFPYDGAKIGICPSNDYWMGFWKNIKEDLSEWNRQLIMIAKKTKEYDHSFKINLDTISSIKKLCDKFDELMRENDRYTKSINNLIRTNLIVWLEDYNKEEGLYKYIQSLFNPKKNGFDLAKIGDTLPRGREVWTDSKSIMVYEDPVIDRIVNDALELNYK